LIVRLQKRAEAEIREAASWYRLRSEGLGKRFLSAIRVAFEQLETAATRYGRLETLPDDAPFRRILLEDFPYLIVFEVVGDDVFIYAVAHSSRRPNYWRRRKRS
jgi:toxin ParE1/3/4